MICIILVAGHGTLLERQIKADPAFSHLVGIPKALLPGVGGRKILDFWWQAVNVRQLFNEVYLVTNADKYKHYERWATASDFPVENIVNDGTTTHENRLGAVADLDLVLRTKDVKDDVLVVAGDMLFEDAQFDMAQVVRYFQQRPSGDLAIYYNMDPAEDQSTRGILKLDPDSHRVTHFWEKPESGQTDCRNASVVFYCLRKSTLESVSQYLGKHTNIDLRNFGTYMEWLVNTQQHHMYGMKLPTGFQLIGQVGLPDYLRWLEIFAGAQHEVGSRPAITKHAYARVGLMGNPSDGFHGKTIALSIENFWAEVTIIESTKLVLLPHPLNDPTEFGSLGDLHGISRKEGYLGGLRLLQATCKKFYQFCSDHGIALPRRNFTLKYDTNIPRQVGLAGSSAIVTATLKCLMQFFNLTEKDMGRELQPQFILEVEKQELYIHAGLQDRVIQVYEGLVYMDFSQELLDAQGHGSYTPLPMTDLPHFWLAYLSDPSDSGKIHSDVSVRWKNGDVEVVEAMKQFAKLTDKARVAVCEGSWAELATLMDKNFDLRRNIYGDAALGAANLHMVATARHFGSAVKFPGSGGAVVGLCLDAEQLDQMKTVMRSEGVVICDLIPHHGGRDHNPPTSSQTKS